MPLKFKSQSLFPETCFPGPQCLWQSSLEVLTLAWDSETCVPVRSWVPCCVSQGLALELTQCRCSEQVWGVNEKFRQAVVRFVALLSRELVARGPLYLQSSLSSSMKAWMLEIMDKGSCERCTGCLDTGSSSGVFLPFQVPGSGGREE